MTGLTTGPAAAPARAWEVRSVAATGSGIVLSTRGGLIAIEPRTPRTIRIRATLEHRLSTRGSLIVDTAAERAPVAFEVVEAATSVTLSTEALRVEVDRATGAISYRDADGRLLTREPAHGGKTLEPVDVVVSVFDEASAVERRDSADGVRLEAVEVRQRVDRRAFHARLEFEWADDEALYGLGSHEEGMFNLRGRHQYLYQQNMKASVPVLLSTRGYGVLVDCTSLMTFHDDAFGSYIWCDVVDELDVYVAVGPEFDTIISEFRDLTGRPPMLPRWAFGYLQSKERYETQEELLEIAREYRRRGLPLDCVVLDWKSWPGDLWGQKSLDPERFPDPDGMAAQLHAMGVHLMASIWPVMQPGGADWNEMHAGGHLLGNQATYDAFSADARGLYWRQTERGLFAHGFDAWWADCTEPFEADWAGAVKPEPEQRLQINVGEAKRYLDPEFINAYSLAHSQGIYEGQRHASDQKRVFTLTRSAYAGQQRYGTVTWSGDLSATWSTLRRQIADGLNFCATGMPYWSTDVGAFFVRRRPDLWFWAGDYDEGVADAGYRELYVRWFQYSAWLPILRSHGTDTPREVWRFGEPGDPEHDALAAALRLRYRLLPYIYSLAGWTTHHGYTMLRALPFDFRDDPAVRDVGDEFMFGPSFLVCPVHAAGAATRPVYLPAGSDWYDFWTEERYAGGQTIVADAPIGRIPVFVRAGSIVPMGPDRQHTAESPGAPLHLHVYAGRDASFTLYEDAGDGFGYERGEFTTVEMRWDDEQQRLTVAPRAGSFPGMPPAREVVAVLHPVSRRDAEAGSDSTAIPAPACADHRVVFEF